MAVQTLPGPRTASIVRSYTDGAQGSGHSR